MKSIQIVTLLLCLCLFAACGSDTPTPTATTDPAIATTTLPTAASQDSNMLMGSAAVDSVQVNVRSTNPPQIEVVARGNYPDGCTQTAAVTQQRQGDTFVVTINTQRPTDAVCTEGLVPFAETFTLQEVADLGSNVYTVNVNGTTAQFDLAAAAQPNTNSGLTASVSPASGAVGTQVQLTAAGLPASAAVNIGFGPVASDYQIIGSTQTDAAGNLNTTLPVPATAGAGDWVFVVVTAGGNAVTNPFTITASVSPTSAPASGNTTGVTGRVNIYLVALEDGGQSGPQIGCNDSIVAVPVDIGATVAPLTAALNYMFSLNDEFYGQSGLYNVFHSSDLAVAGINIVNKKAIIDLTGNVSLGGVCDEPRFEAQIRETALQFDTIDTVEILFNGRPLSETIGGK